MTQSASMSISTTNPCPRVPYESLGNFTGKRVRLAGKVVNLAGSTLTIQCDPDNESSVVTVSLSGVAPVDQYCEVEGTVQSGNSIEENSSCGLGNDFDLGLYKEVVVQMNRDKYAGLYL